NATTPNVNALIVNGSTLYIGGDFVAVGSTARRRLAAWDLSTNSLLSWNPSVDAPVRALALDSTNNLLYVGGDIQTVNFTTSRVYLAAVSTSTGTANSWDPHMNNVVRALALDGANSVLYAGGDF